MIYNPEKTTKKSALAIIAGLLILGFILAGCTPKGNPKALYQEGQKLAEQKKFEEAAKKFYEYTQKKPDDPQGFVMLYRALMEIKRTDEAYTMLSRGLEKHPDNGLLNLEMGKFYISKGMFEKAKEKLDKAATINPDNPTPRYLKGILLVQEGDDKAAYQVFKDLIALDPSSSEANKEAVTLAYTFLLEMIGTSARTDTESFSVITKAIKFMPDYSRGYTVLGIYYYKQNKMDSALKRFKIALQKGSEPNGKNREAYVYRLIGRIFDDQGNHEKALENYQKFLEIYSPDGRTKINPKDAAEVRVFGGVVKDVLNIQGVRERVKELKN